MSWMMSQRLPSKEPLLVLVVFQVFIVTWLVNKPSCRPPMYRLSVGVVDTITPSDTRHPPKVRDLHMSLLHVKSSAANSKAKNQSSLEEPQCRGWHALDPSKKNVGLLVVVKTAPGNRLRRQKIRELWADQCAKGDLLFPAESSQLPGGSRVKCVFVIGHSAAGRVEESLKQEQTDSEDVVVGPMVDSYGTMTSKTMWTLQWSLRTYCYRHLIFADDDAYVFFSRLLPYLSVNTARRQGGLYLGHGHWNYDVFHCSDQPHPNCVDPKIYPNKHFFPFASGFSYLLSRDVVEKAVQHALVHVSQPLTIPGNTEDAMVGHVLHEANVPLQKHTGFVHWHSTEERCPGMVQHDSPVLVVGNAPDYVLQRLAINEKQSLPLCTGL